MKGRRYVKIFNREIYQEDIIKSLAITLLAVFICVASIIMIIISDTQQQLTAICFEVCSALGTVGFSLGITPELSHFAKTILMFLMFIGRIGFPSIFLIIRGRNNKQEKYRYPKEKLIIG